MEWQASARSAEVDQVYAEVDQVYDVSEVGLPAGAIVPTRLIPQDKAVCEPSGSVAFDLNGQRKKAGEGSLAYAPTGATLD